MKYVKQISQTAFAEAMTKVEQTVPKDINVKPSSKNEDEHKQEEEKEKKQKLIWHLMQMNQ